MDRPVRDAVMLGVILFAVATVIFLGFSIFGTSKGVVNEGTVKNQDAVSDFSRLKFTDYDNTVVTGQMLKAAYKDFQGVDISIFISTNAMLSKGNVAKTPDIKYIQRIGSRDYINYNAIISNDSTGGIKDSVMCKNGEILKNGKSDIFKEQDGRVFTDMPFCLDPNGEVMCSTATSGWQHNNSVEYIDVNSKFDALLLVDSSNEIKGLVFTQK